MTQVRNCFSAFAFNYDLILLYLLLECPPSECDFHYLVVENVALFQAIHKSSRTDCIPRANAPHVAY